MRNRIHFYRDYRNHNKRIDGRGGGASSNLYHVRAEDLFDIIKDALHRLPDSETSLYTLFNIVNRHGTLTQAPNYRHQHDEMLQRVHRIFVDMAKMNAINPSLQERFNENDVIKLNTLASIYTFYLDD